MTEDDLSAIAAYLGIRPADREVLAALRDAWLARIPAMVDDFYARILSDADAVKVFANTRMVEGLKQSLRRWAAELLDPPSAGAWLADRVRIGLRHVEVGLPPRFMPLAMNVVRRHFHEVAYLGLRERTDAMPESLAAIDRRLDLELAIMLESYRESAEVRLLQQERLATIVRLATGVSFDLRNPLGTINTSVLLIREALERSSRGEDRSLTEPLERIVRASRRARDIAGSLFEYARVKRPRRIRCPARGVVDEALSLAGERGGVAIEVEFRPDDLQVHCDPGDLARAVANLVRNGLDAIGQSGVGGRIAIRAAREGASLTLDVHDDGPGVAPEIRERVFEPLVTTRGDGTGLGLPISRELVEAQGGSLELKDGEGRGSWFRIRLPD